MSDIPSRLTAFKLRLEKACHAAHRDPSSVTLIAASKTQSPLTIQAAFNLGVRDFGENYLQEALEKISQCSMFKPTWHYIGSIQSNKCTKIAQHFDMVHTVSSFKIAQRLNAARQLSPLPVCLQLKVAENEQKDGLTVEEALALANAWSNFPLLSLVGIMAMPDPQPSFALQCKAYEPAVHLFEQLKSLGFPVDVLSMGMSDDLEAAIAMGATHIRVGRALFGSRS